MSYYKCDGCKELVDTDADPEGWVETKYGDAYYCEPCRDEREAFQDKADRMCAIAEEIYR